MPYCNCAVSVADFFKKKSYRQGCASSIPVFEKKGKKRGLTIGVNRLRTGGHTIDAQNQRMLFVPTFALAILQKTGLFILSTDSFLLHLTERLKRFTENEKKRSEREKRLIICIFSAFLAHI